MAEPKPELNRWNSSFGLVWEDGTPLDPDTSPETLVELAAQRARGEEITRQEMAKEAEREARHGKGRRKGTSEAEKERSDSQRL